MSDSPLPRPRKSDSDGRSGMARATVIASQISTAGSSIVVCSLVGYGLDRWLGSAPVGIVIGALIGLGLGGLQIFALIQQLTPPSPVSKREAQDKD